jgi:anti-sigma28 factor (negative regulator of flagellin synthesis)
MQTDVGAIETDQLGGKVKKSLRSKRSGRQDARTTSWNNHFATPEKQAMVSRGMQAAERWSEARADRLEELRAQVEAGIYKVDSRAIAESMLQNQTHFLDEVL